MAMYYNTPLAYTLAAPHHLYTTVQAPITYPFYPNHPYLNHCWPVGALPYTHHPWTGVPQTYNHNWAAVPRNHQVVTRALAPAPEVIYSTPRAVVPSYTATYPQPQARTRTRGLLVDTYKAPTWTSHQNHAPSQTLTPYSVPASTSVGTSTSVFAPRRAVPVHDTQYIRSLNWPSLGPHRPLAPPRRRGAPPQVPAPAPAPAPVPVPGAAKGTAGRSLRIAFGLRRRIERKEGVPLSFLLQEDVGTLKRLVARPYERVLPRNNSNGSGSECGPCTITLRFWSPMHPYPVQEYKVPVVDSSGRDVDMTRLGLALHVAEAYRMFFKAAACAPVPAGSKSALKTTVLEQKTVSMGHLWLVSLRETEREGVYDVGIQNHGPRASPVW